MKTRSLFGLFAALFILFSLPGCSEPPELHPRGLVESCPDLEGQWVGSCQNTGPVKLWVSQSGCETVKISSLFLDDEGNIVDMAQYNLAPGPVADAGVTDVSREGPDSESGSVAESYWDGDGGLMVDDSQKGESKDGGKWDASFIGLFDRVGDTLYLHDVEGTLPSGPCEAVLQP